MQPQLMLALFEALSNWRSLLCMGIVPVIALIPDLLMKFLHKVYWPTPADKLARAEKLKLLSPEQTKVDRLAAGEDYDSTSNGETDAGGPSPLKIDGFNGLTDTRSSNAPMKENCRSPSKKHPLEQERAK